MTKNILSILYFLCQIEFLLLNMLKFQIFPGKMANLIKLIFNLCFILLQLQLF